jgi:hemolysin III
VAASIYSLSLVSMLTLSAAYNLWPVCPMKWWLRRLDQSGIYVLIAATYTPFVVHADESSSALWVLIGVWSVAALGIAAALALPGRVDRVSIALYVVMGWSVVALWSAKDILIPFTAFRLLLAGGILVTAGLIFHVWQNLRFQNAIWHLFVLLGISCHYAAVLTLVPGQAAT